MRDDGPRVAPRMVGHIPDYSGRFGAPVAPPREWFTKPAYLRDDAYVVLEHSGQAYGRFYSSGVPSLEDDKGRHIIQPSPSGYQAFLRGSVTCEDGERVAVGVVTRGGHWEPATDPANVVAVVTVGDDAAGGWFSGSLVWECTRAQAAEAARGQFSGEWQPMPEAWCASHGVAPQYLRVVRAVC